VTSYVPPEDRAAHWAQDAAALYAAGHTVEEIAAVLWVGTGTALELARSGMLPLALDRLEPLLGSTGTADDWIDARVTDYVETDLLDPDAALTLVTLAICSGDALVLAEPGQQWTVRPECEGDPALPNSLTLTGRTGPLADVHSSDGRQDDIDLYLLGTYYQLTAWHCEDQEVS
jgi:hypothetical protein